MMLGVIRSPGLALCLEHETVGTCLGYVVLRTPGGGSDDKPHFSQFPLCLSKALLTVGPQSSLWGVVLTSGAMNLVCILG